MQKNLLQLDQSNWWVLLIVVLAIGLTWFLYNSKKKPWTKVQNGLLSGIRFIAIFLTLLLLLEPLINTTTTRIEAPIVSLAIDNSQSVTARAVDTVVFQRQLDEVIHSLEEQGIEVRKFYLTDSDTPRFDVPTTNLSNLLNKVSDNMEGRNWAANVLISDGIFNSGSSPIYKEYLTPQFTIGLGDTIPPKDINISRILYNRVTFKGNETPIKIEVSQKGYDNQEIQIELIEKGVSLEKRKIKLGQSIQEITFTVKSEEEGLRKIQVRATQLPDEFIHNNNQSNVFMEVIDGRQKILVVAQSPHPDIKAIRSVLSISDNYQTDVWIPSINEETPKGIYDVVVYHGAFSQRLDFTPKESPGIWYILNDNSSLQLMNRAIPFLNIQKRGSQPDLVTGSFNQRFSKFKIPENQNQFEDLPPISVPFGEYATSGPVEVLMYQRVGSVVTKKPLFFFYDDGSQKGAVLAGQNIWKWKLQEAAINGNSTHFNDIITKTIQFLSVKNEQQQFRFRSRGNNFSDLEPILFDSEVYNDIYERIYGNQISLQVTSEEGKRLDYNFVDSELNSSFKIPTLASGIYAYRASVKIGDKNFTDRGQFIVEEINREYQNVTADHNLLKGLAIKTDGEYLHQSELPTLAQTLESKNFKSVVRSSESLFPLIQSKWMLLIILLLFATEWLLRKYWGGY